MKFAYNPDPKKSVKVYGRSIRVSTKNSATVCSAVTGTTLAKAKRMLENLIAQKNSLDGRYYTKISGELLGLLKSAESNADFKGMDADSMVVHASAHKAFKFRTPRRFKLGRKVRHLTNFQVVLAIG